MNSQLPYIVAGFKLHTTYCPTNMQTASSCHSPKYATTGAAVSQGRRTGVCREFPHIRRSPSSLHSWPIHSFIHSHPRKTRHRCAHARASPSPHLPWQLRGVVQLRRSRHLEGRVPHVAQDKGQDFPVPRLECAGPFRTWHGKVAGSILRDVGNASA